jgi:hypothetical protein
MEFLMRGQYKFDAKVKKIRSDNGNEFKNDEVEEYLDQEGIKHEFSPPLIFHNKIGWPKERRTLIESTRTMLDEYKTFNHFWLKQSIWHVMLSTDSISTIS